MIDIVGIGPFVVSSLVIKAMGGPQAMIAWLAGAVIATLDAFVWSELGAAMPKAGGTYVFLREAYGPNKWGRLMSFLFVWQTFIQAPLSVASASIGFARYASYLHPLTKWEAKAISGGLVLILIVLLYRRITTIGKISVLLWAGVIGTMLWLIWGGMTHFDRKIAFDFPAGAFSFSSLWFAGLGSAMVSTVYSYWGYYNICHLGGEIKQPEKNIPRGIFLSVLVLGALALILSVTLDLQTSIAGILAVRLIVQFIGQAVGLMMLRRRWGPEKFPFKMWLYPVPAVLTMFGWAWLFWQTGAARKWGLLEIAMGAVAYLIWAKEKKQWPFGEKVLSDKF